jgi:ankyrin repeat protein
MNLENLKIQSPLEKNMLSHEKKENTSSIDYSKEFFLAAFKGNLIALKKLFEGASQKIDVNKKFLKAGVTSLYVAAQNGHLDVVNYLLSIQDVDINLAREDNNYLPLHTAVLKGHIHIVEAILKTSQKKSIININNKVLPEGFTALYMAAQEGHIDIMKLLLAEGADPNSKNIYGATPLDIAIQTNHYDCGMLLDGFDQGIHSCIIQRMRALGFESNGPGICFGFAQTAKLFILSGKKTSQILYDTLFLIKSLTVKDLLLMKNAYDNRQLSPEQEKQYLNILALFNGIELEFQGGNYPHLLEKKFSLQHENPSWVTPLIQPITLEKKGGETNILSFTGAYTPRELSIYFEKLRNSLKERKCIDELVALTLSSSDHTISIIYDCLEDTWEILDANKTPSTHKELKTQLISGNTDISKEIANCFFSKNGEAIFQTQVSSSRDSKTMVESAILAWKKELTPLHMVTLEKINMRDYKNASWLFTAAKVGEVETVEKLISYGANVNSEALDQSISPLYIATQNGHLKIIKILLSQLKLKPNIRKKDEGYTPFYTAVQLGRLKILKLFIESKLEEKFNPNLASYDGETPIMIAAEEGYYSIVEFLLKIESIQLGATDKGVTALMISIQNMHFDISLAILKKKSYEIDPNIQDKLGLTVLHWASTKGHVEIINELLKNNFKTAININLKTLQGATPLYCATQSDHSEAVRLLLEAGVDVNAGLNKITPAYKASEEGYFNTLKVLIQHDADLNISNEDGKTPAFIAAQNNRAEIIKLLVESKADLTKKTIEGFSPIHIAAQNNSKEVMQVLINPQYHLNVDQEGDKKYTALNLAVIHHRVEIVDMLVKSGADIKHECNDGTPLILAVKVKDYAIIKYLLSNDVNPLQTDRAEHTALYYALIDRQYEIASLLLKGVFLSRLKKEDQLLTEKYQAYLSLYDDRFKIKSLKRNLPMQVLVNEKSETKSYIKKRKLFIENYEKRLEIQVNKNARHQEKSTTQNNKPNNLFTRGSR